MSAPVDTLRPYLEAAREGDDKALASLIAATQPAVWRLCTALGSAGEHEDLMQETYLRAIRSLQSFRGDAPVQVWLLSIARRVCADHVRRRQRQRRILDRVQRFTDRSAAPHSESIDHLIDQLDPERREAFALTQIVGLSYDEAAAVIGCPIGTIRSRVARARADLQSTIGASEAM